MPDACSFLLGEIPWEGAAADGTKSATLVGTRAAGVPFTGVIAPDGSIRMVKITDDVQFQGWFTDADTLHMVLWEAGEHAVVGTRSATRVAD